MHTTNTHDRRHALGLLAASGLASLAGLRCQLAAAPAKTPMEVWKDPNCGCCKDWIALMEKPALP
jgi:hypothetical protein